MSLRTGMAGGTLPSVAVRTASRSRSSAQLHPVADASWHMNRHAPVPRFACLGEPIKARTTGPIEPRANALLHPLWGASRLNGFQALKRHTERSPSCSLTQPRFLDERVAALHLLVPLCYRRGVGSDGVSGLLEPLPDAMMRVLRRIEHVVLVTHELRAHGALAVNYFVG